jgi:tRNA-Thr(GGU) m(6)t(6)A37 methyltransferase TsaA
MSCDPVSPGQVYDVRVIGTVQSSLREPQQAPLQADEGAPDAWLLFSASAAGALKGLAPGEDILVLTWLHLADRGVLRVHPRGDARNPLRGVFGTRSPDRPNPIGIHRTSILEVEPTRLHVAALEAVDGTPILDIKAVLHAEDR